ncbi:hypothetical protein BCR35DRAFT_299736 [Leucosporidium creatinivorum]|uniref:Uncharacterized protein n=1 Tax=Leucosporidium creatinivorum TaxID=106004 RepID=A0A1Y2G0K3_9BASI|nr:hypothetical protein BCR35DRAFT_299736 [Leucosporidium creatinivorum]
MRKSGMRRVSLCLFPVSCLARSVFSALPASLVNLFPLRPLLSSTSFSQPNTYNPTARQHRRQFAQKRGGHYRNEAEAMKRAQALLAAEDEDSESGAEGGKGGGVPPVPKVPNGL